MCAVLAPMSPPKSNKRSSHVVPVNDMAAEADAEAEDDGEAVAPAKKKTPGKGQKPAGANTAMRHLRRAVCSRS